MQTTLLQVDAFGVLEELLTEQCGHVPTSFELLLQHSDRFTLLVADHIGARQPSDCLGALTGTTHSSSLCFKRLILLVHTSTS